MLNSDLFYEARDSVDRGKYLKATTETLVKYLNELCVFREIHIQRNNNDFVDKINQWIRKLKTEIEKRKEAELNPPKPIDVSIVNATTPLHIVLPPKKFYEKPLGIILIAVIAGLIVVFLAYKFGWY